MWDEKTRSELALEKSVVPSLGRPKVFYLRGLRCAVLNVAKGGKEEPIGHIDRLWETEELAGFQGKQ